MISMSKAKTYRYLGAALLAAAVLLCSCSDDTLQDEDEQLATVQVSLTIQTRATTSDGYYEEGVGYENYINIAGGDYRIYFFDSDNKYIASLEPETFVADNDNYTVYSLTGKLSTGLAQLLNSEENGFKIVMLANWGSGYPSTLAAGTTIDDVCEASWSQFNHLYNFELGPNNLIPFFGVTEYNGYTFVRDVVTELQEPISLLRAVAKVEVVLDVEDYDLFTFDEVTLHHYNNKGYCAPDKVYKRGDYDHYNIDGEADRWAADFVEDLHLVNDGNDHTGTGDPEDKSLSFLKTKENSADDGTKETWTAYVPEYDNTTDEDDYSYIEVKLKGYPDTYKIYFADDYDTNDGSSEAYTDKEKTSHRLDIHRNYLYRYYVTLGKNNLLNVHVNKWTAEYENEFVFDTDESEEHNDD